MTTAAVITVIVVPLLGFILWWWRRKLEVPATPADVLKRYEDESRKAIANQDTDAINRIVSERLRAIGRNTSGQGDNAASKGTTSTAGWLPRAGRNDAGNVGRAGKT